MTLRSKMVATISAFCLVLAMLIIGVWAAQSVKVEMGGSLTFDANDVNVKIEGTIEGTSEPQTLDTLIFSANESESRGDASTWQNKQLEFGRTDESVNNITITVTITNLSKENAVNVKILDKFATDNVTKTITKDGSVYNIGEEFAIEKSSDASETSTIIVFKFEVANKTKPVSNAQFGYSIDLSDESYVAPSPVVAQGPGTVDFVDNGDGTTTLTATPNDGAVFVGWKDGNGKYTDINTWDYDTNVQVAMYLGKNIGDTIYVNEFVDYSFYDDSMSAQVEELKTLIDGLKETWSEWTYNEMLIAIQNLETGNFYYTIDNDGSSYTAVFSNNTKKPVSEGEYTFDYYEDANIAFITDCSITSGEIVLPETILEYAGSQVVGFKPNLFEAGATTIKQQIFQDNNTITKITIPDSFVDLTRFAFCNMTSLQEVQIEANINVLKQGTFCDCNSLQKFNIPSSVDYIDLIWWGNANLNLNLNYVIFEESTNWQVAPGDASEKVIYVDVIEDLSDPITAASCVKDPINYEYWKKVV